MSEPREHTFGVKGRARKRPVVIDYVRWIGDQPAMHRFMPGVQLALTQYDKDVPVPGLLIPTLEGEMRADAGDYIIKGVQGEFYPCKPYIFEATYEPDAATVSISCRRSREGRTMSDDRESVLPTVHPNSEQTDREAPLPVCTHGQVRQWNHAGIVWECAACYRAMQTEMEALRAELAFYHDAIPCNTEGGSCRACDLLRITP